MSGASLRLESFAPGIPPRGLPTIADIERARQEGYEQGASDVMALKLDRLSEELGRVGERLTDLDRETARVRQATLNEVAPLLDLVIELLGPEHIRAALMDRLGQELRMLSEAEPRGPIRLTCTPDLAGLVQQCVDRARIEAVIETAAGTDPSLEICTEANRLRFEPARMMASFRSLIQELAREE